MEAQEHQSTKREHQRASILSSLSRGATRSAACRAAGLARRTLYNWIEQDPAFREQVEDAELEAVENVEGMAYECAMMASEDHRYQRSMLAFLKARSPAWGAPAIREPEPAGPPEPEPEPVDPATYGYAPYGPPRIPPEYDISEPDVIALREEMENGPPEKQQPRGSIGYLMAHQTLLRQRLIARLDAIWYEHTERLAREGNPVPRPDLPEGFHSPVLYLIREAHHSPYDAAQKLGISLPEKPYPPLPTWPPPEVHYPYRYAEPSPTTTGEAATLEKQAPLDEAATAEDTATPEETATPGLSTTSAPSNTRPPQNRPPAPSQPPAGPARAGVSATLF